MAALTALQQLPPEAWGHRLHRMRILCDHTLAEVVEGLSEFMELSDSTLSRMESLEEPPTDKRRRRKAWALAVFYGFDPATLDLTDDDRPPLTIVNGLLDQDFSDSRCSLSRELTLFEDAEQDAA